MAKEKKKKVNVKKEDKKQKHFWKEYKAKLKKVNWQSPKELINSTAAVLVIVFIVAAIVIILDLGLNFLNKLEAKGIETLQNSITSEQLTDTNSVNSLGNEITENELNSAMNNTVE